MNLKELEHDTLEEAKIMPRQLSRREPEKEILTTQDAIREQKRERRQWHSRPWCHVDNPEIWTGTTDDD